MKTILCIVFALIGHVSYAIEDVSVRLSPSFYDPSSGSIYVDVEIRYDGMGNFRLADQNIRLFYDADQLHLQKDYSRSDLPQDLYSNIKWYEVMENLSADHVNQLRFDDELGFINFSIDLEQDTRGGITLARDHSWQRIAVLNFKVEDASALSQIVWSTPEVTDKYATAFVEVMEWVAPNRTRKTDITNYIDALFSAEEDASSMDISVYPNPAESFITITFEKELASMALVSVMDVTGRKVLEVKKKAGATYAEFDVSSLSAGSYHVEIKDLLSDRVVANEQLIKTQM